MNAIAAATRAAWSARIGWNVLNAAQMLFTVLWTAFWTAAALLLLAVSRQHRWPLRMASRVWAPGLLAGAGARLQVEGADRIDWSQPHVLVCNHQSLMDICVVFLAVPVPLRFMLKRELAAVPFLGWYARAMGMVFIDRGNARSARNSLSLAREQIRAGATVCAFAEGTRSKNGRVGPFKGGAFQLAIEAGAALIPVAIEGSGRVLPAAGFRVRPGLIRLRFGAPIATAGSQAGDRQALARQAHDAVVRLLHQGEETSPTG